MLIEFFSGIMSAVNWMAEVVSCAVRCVRWTYVAPGKQAALLVLLHCVLLSMLAIPASRMADAR